MLRDRPKEEFCHCISIALARQRELLPGRWNIQDHPAPPRELICQPPSTSDHIEIGIVQGASFLWRLTFGVSRARLRASAAPHCWATPISLRQLVQEQSALLEDFALDFAPSPENQSPRADGIQGAESLPCGSSRPGTQTTHALPLSCLTSLKL